MDLFLTLFVIYSIFRASIAPPVDQKKAAGDQTTLSPDDFRNDPNYRIEYERYLQEVVQLLEEDPGFRAKLENASSDEIDSGRIAKQLHFVNHTIRDKLTEAKRREVERINDLTEKLAEKWPEKNAARRDHYEHGKELFDEEDLKKLIFKAKRDMDQIDQLRRDQFKMYEMEKRFLEEQQLGLLDGEELKKKQAEQIEQKKKHADHKNVNHPFDEQQLEEVWHDVDKLDGDVDAITLFKIHDVDENGVWDINEVEAFFQHELDKVYLANITEDDMNERIEEMNLIREHIFKEADYNSDKVISFEEFDQARKQSVKDKDKPWETIEKTPPVFTEGEYQTFKQIKQAVAALEPTPATSTIKSAVS